MICGLVLALTACGSGETPTPETSTSTSSDTASPSDRSPATVTMTSTVTEAPPSAEPTDSTTDSASSTSSSSAPIPETVEDEVEPLESEHDQDSDEWTTPTAAEPEPEADDFDAAWAQECAGRVVRDMETVDERLLDGISVSSGLDLLSGSFDCFDDAGIPPGSDEAEYLSLVWTLSDFTSDAADLYWDDPMTATAKYQVVRENTESLFATINAATGSDYRVP